MIKTIRLTLFILLTPLHCLLGQPQPQVLGHYSNLSSLASYNGNAYFIYNDSVTSYPQGILVKGVTGQHYNLNINPLTYGLTGCGSNPGGFVRAGNNLFFVSNGFYNNQNNCTQLWITKLSDTFASTINVADQMCSGFVQLYYTPYQVSCALGNKLIFAADSSCGKYGLYESDGILPAAKWITSLPNGLLHLNTLGNNVIYIDGGTNVFRYNGSSIQSLGSMCNCTPGHFSMIGTSGNTAWYSISFVGYPITKIYKVNSAGVSFVKQIKRCHDIKIHNNNFYYDADTTTNNSESPLYVSDTNFNNVVMLHTAGGYYSDYGFDELFFFKNKTYFVTDTSTTGVELWTTDGTIGGTKILTDIFPGPSSSLSVPSSNLNNHIRDSLFVFSCDKFYFWAKDGTNVKSLWMSDGTPGGTSLFYDFGPGPLTLSNSSTLAIAMEACSSM